MNHYSPHDDSSSKERSARHQEHAPHLVLSCECWGEGEGKCQDELGWIFFVVVVVVLVEFTYQKLVSV